MAFILYTVRRKAVVILQRFDNSVLVKYVKSGIESSINPDLIRKTTIKETVNKKTTKKSESKNLGKQTSFDFPS